MIDEATRRELVRDLRAKAVAAAVRAKPGPDEIVTATWGDHVAELWVPCRQDDDTPTIRLVLYRPTDDSVRETVFTPKGPVERALPRRHVRWLSRPTEDAIAEALLGLFLASVASPLT